MVGSAWLKESKNAAELVGGHAEADAVILNLDLDTEGGQVAHGTSWLGMGFLGR
jgi:hypothetical protein